MFKVGDRIAVLGDTIKGRIVTIKGRIVEIEDEDGFLRRYPMQSIVLQKRSADYKIGNELKDKEAAQLLEKRTKMAEANRIKEQATVYPKVIDLHIEMLRDAHSHMSNYEIIQVQMTTCRSFIRQAIENGSKKVVLIHGKGQGVLKSEIHHYLTRLNNELGVPITFHDASFRSYGIGGATEVVIGG